MKLVNAQTGALEDVPDEQVPQAYAAKTHGFASPDEKIPVKLADGRIGSVPASQAHAAFASGATIATPQEQAQKKYGGALGTAVAGAEGLARGATVGLSDPIATGLAGLVGGDSAKQSVREHLQGEKEASPYISGGAEIAGAALPTILSGGAAAPEEAAALGAGEAANGASRVAKLARVLGAPARAVGAAGEVAGGLADAALGAPGAGGAMARIARVAAKAGVTGAAEGGLFGAGQEISEDTLGDHELTAEKLAASVGHGALYGAMLGTGLGGAGAAVREGGASILNKIAPSLDRQASVEAYKALHPKLGVTKEVIARAGGEEAVGETARKFNLLGTSMSEATGDPEAILGRTQAAKEQVGQQIEQQLAASGERGASAKASEAIAPLDKTIAELESTAAGSQKAAPLKAFRDQLAESLGMTTEQVPRSSDEVKAWMKENPEALQKMGNGSLPTEAFSKTVTKDADVPLAKLVAERRALQANVYQYQKSLTAPLHIEELRKFSGHLNDLEEQAMNKASEAVGGKEGTQLRAMNKDYQRLSLIERATKDRVATQGTNQRLSLTDKIMGAGTLAGGLASGHPATALAAGATSLASKFVREKGNAMASVALGRLSKLDLLARASESVDKELDGAFAKYAEKGPTSTKIRLRHFGGDKNETPRERYEKARASVPASAAPNLRTEHVERAIPGLSVHAPMTSLALGQTVAKGAAYLSANQPKAQGTPSILGRPSHPPEGALSAYVRQSNAVDDPVGTIKRGLETGKIHTDEIQAIAQTKPKLYAQIQKQAIDTAAKHRDSMSYDKVMTLSKVAQMPLDQSLTKEGFEFLQGTFTQPQGGPQGHPGEMPKGQPKREIKGISDLTSLKDGTL